MQRKSHGVSHHQAVANYFRKKHHLRLTTSIFWYISSHPVPSNSSERSIKDKIGYLFEHFYFYKLKKSRRGFPRRPETRRKANYVEKFYV